VDEYPNARSIVDPTLDRMLISHARDAEGANPGLYAWDLRGAPGWHRVPVAGLSVDSTLGGAAALDPVTERWIFHLGGARVGSIQLSAGGLSWLEWTGISGAPQRMGPDAGGVLDPLGHRFVMFGDVLDLNLIPAMAWALSLDGAAMWSPLGTTGDPPGTRRMPWLAYEDRTDAITLTGGYYSQNDVIELRFDRTFAPVPAAPLTITDVRVNNTTDMTVSLSWTAVGERWLIGHAHHYALHAALHPMADADFDAAPFQSLVIPTVDAGFTETAQLMGLPRDSLLYFAVRAYDGSGTASAISNQPSARPGRAAQVAPGLAFAANPSRSPVTIVWQADPSAPWSPSALRLFDVTGRVRRTVDLGWGPGGSYIWDGRDDDGRRMAAGLYFGRLTSGGKVVKARLVLVP
jgi:hypothetical protein